MKEINLDPKSDCIIERVSHRFGEVPNLLMRDVNGYTAVAFWFDRDYSLYLKDYGDHKVSKICEKTFSSMYERLKNSERSMFLQYETEFIKAYEEYLAEQILLGDIEEYLTDEPNRID